MLVAQNADGSPLTQQFDRLFKTFFAIKHLDAGTRPYAAHVFVDEAVA